MDIRTNYNRIILKRSDIAGVVPTISTQSQTLSEEWIDTDIYKGELFVNLVDDTIYTRTNNGIIEFKSGTTQSLEQVINQNPVANVTDKEVVINTLSFFASSTDGLNLKSINMDEGLTHSIVLEDGISDNNKKGARYTSDYTLNWDINTPDSMLVTKGYVDRNSGGGGTAGDLLSVLEAGDYAEHGDSSYYFGVDGTFINGYDGDVEYLIDTNPNYTQITRTSDSNTLDQSSILLDPDGILFETSNVIEFNLHDSGVDMLVRTPTTEIKYLDSYSDVFGTHSNVISETIGLAIPNVDYYQSRLYKMNGIGLVNVREINSTTEYTLDYIEDSIKSNLGGVKAYNRVISEGGYISSAIGIQSTATASDSRGIYFASDPYGGGTNDGSFIKDNLSALNERGIKYQSDYTANWDSNTPDTMLATKGYVDNNSGGTPVSQTSYHQFASGSDNDAFYDDGFLEFSWNAPSGRPEIKMLVEPSGSGDMRSLAIRSDGTSQNTFITQPNFTYTLFTSGVTAGDKCVITIGAEDDPTFPFYNVTIYNLGSSSNTSFVIEKIN